MSTHILCYITATTELKHFNFVLKIEAEGEGAGRVRTVLLRRASLKRGVSLELS